LFFNIIKFLSVCIKIIINSTLAKSNFTILLKDMVFFINFKKVLHILYNITPLFKLKILDLSTGLLKEWPYKEIIA